MGKFWKKGFIFGVVVLSLFVAGVCFAFGGKVSYPDGSPAVGATVNLVESTGLERTTTCDPNGQFQFTRVAAGDATVQIKAPDGKNYAPVVLPAALFASGQTAIVLQPK